MFPKNKTENTCFGHLQKTKTSAVRNKNKVKIQNMFSLNFYCGSADKKVFLHVDKFSKSTKMHQASSHLAVNSF